MKWVLGLVVLVIIGGAAYFLFKPAAYAPTAQQSTTAQPSTQPSSGSAAMQQVTITGTEFAFTPSTLTVKVGQPVQLTFKNNGKYPHNLTIAQLGVATKTIQPGEQDTVTFTPTKTGSFSFACTVPGHADRGMTGTLTVQ